MKFDYIDIHSHLNFSQFDEDREEIISKMKSEKIGAICVGADYKTSKECVELANKHENIWATIGIHPNDWEEGWDEEKFEKLLNNKVVGIGECGLDYSQNNDESEKERQRTLFKKQIEFAKKHNLPLMIHCRDEYEEVSNILNEYNVWGNVHFFVGTLDVAKKFLNMNFTLSYTGVITYTEDYNDVVRNTPIDKIMIETDAPFVAPVPYRGKRNEPSYVKEIIKKIAKIKGENYEKVKKQILRNTVARWGLL